MRRPQFSLRTLLIVATLLAPIMARLAPVAAHLMTVMRQSGTTQGSLDESYEAVEAQSIYLGVIWEKPGIGMEQQETKLEVDP